jgi:hypothetical protein
MVCSAVMRWLEGNSDKSDSLISQFPGHRTGNEMRTLGTRLPSCWENLSIPLLYSVMSLLLIPRQAVRTKN